MGDKDRRTSNVPRGASSSGTPTPSRDLPSRSGISALLSGDSGPVKTLSDARSWLDKKGWVLAGEQYDRSKMTNILFTVSLLPKLPLDAVAAIRAVALIIEDNIEDSLSSALSSAIADKFLARIGNVPDELTRAKEFLEATSTKQASTVVQLHETATQHATTTTNLVEILTKLATTEASHLSAPPQWPSIQNSGPSPNSCPSSLHDPSASDSNVRIQQRLLLASRTVLIEIDRSHASSPTERTPQIALKIRDDLNKRLCDLDAGNFGLVDRPGENTKIRGIQTLERGAYLFELNSPAAADRFRSYCVEFDLLTASLGVSARVKDKAFNLVFRFVPRQSSFDPSDPDHISAIETDNGLDPGAISSASWLKKPERRSPNQNVASLKVTCSSPEAANHLLRKRVYIAGHVVTIRKDLREPIRCNKCQLYGHIRGACLSDEKCAHCASNDHTTTDCRPNQRPCCVSCGPDSNHASSSCTCPAFKEKCIALDARYPENSMPYFPTDERWTWAQAPPKLSNAPPQPQPLLQPPPQSEPQPQSQPQSQSQRPRDNGWQQAPSRYRQTTLPGAPSHSNSSPKRSQTIRTPSSSQ
jgi:hypothetical protein